MFCSHCGHRAANRFCSQCGQALEGESDGGVAIAVVDERWEDECRYEAFLRSSHVRDTIARHATYARKGMTGEQFLKICDKLMPIGVPMDSLASVIQPIYAALGISTGKQRVEQLPFSIGRVMLRALCSLARRGQSLKDVRQAADGCVFTAVFPSDLFALEGEILVSLRRRDRATEVNAATKIGGQWFDWGKSNRALEKLFGDLQLEPG
jgi:hypothetical protein